MWVCFFVPFAYFCGMIEPYEVLDVCPIVIVRTLDNCYRGGCTVLDSISDDLNLRLLADINRVLCWWVELP